MKIEAPFFVPIISDDCDFFNEIKKELVEIIMDIHKNAPYQIQGNFPNNINLKYNLTESNSDFLKIKEQPIIKLRSWLLEKLLNTYSMIKIKSKEIVITESWFHVTKNEGFHNLHTHPDTPLGGIFYVESGGSDEGNLWMNPIPGFSHRISDIWCKPFFETKFIPGKLILFPGWVLHSAKSHKGSKDRIVIAFNTTAILHDDQIIHLSKLRTS